MVVGVGDGEVRLLGRRPCMYPRRLSEGWARPSCTAEAAPGSPARFGAVLGGALWCSLSSRERNYLFFLGLRFKCMIGDLGVTAMSVSPQDIDSATG